MAFSKVLTDLNSEVLSSLVKAKQMSNTHKFDDRSFAIGYLQGAGYPADMSGDLVLDCGLGSTPDLEFVSRQPL